MKRAPMIWTWAGWEPAQFYRRLGGFHEAQEGNALWLPEWWAELHSETTAKALAAAGVNWVTTHFFKGFGLQAEAEEIELTRQLIRNYHRHGVRVFTYIQYGTLMPETLGQVWGRADWNGQHTGHPYEYGDQYWRRKPCANQPGFRDYLLHVVEAALATGADGIWIDNLQADGCHCEDCQQAFRAYLKKHVPDPWRDLGLRDVSRVVIPRAERPRDPVFQQWIRFRCDETATSLRLLADKARSLKPDVLVCANIGLGNHQRHILDNGNWLTNLAALDFTYAENDCLPRWEAGRIVTQHFPAKIAEALGIKIVPGASAPLRKVGLYHRAGIPDERTLRRVFAESALFGGHAHGGPWGLRGPTMAFTHDKHLRDTTRQLAERYRDFQAGEDASEVGLFYSFEAMAWDEPRSRQAFRAMEQLLLQNQIPFRYVLSDRLDALAELKLLILPHVLPVSDALADQLRKFGGKLLATGRTSLYDEWMRQRRDYALGDVFGVKYSDDFEERNLHRLVKNNGHVFAPGEWHLDPDCRVTDRQLLRAIHAVVPPVVKCPARHVVCAVRRLPDGKRLVGLINYRDKVVRGITLRGGKKLPALDVELLVRA